MLLLLLCSLESSAWDVWRGRQCGRVSPPTRFGLAAVVQDGTASLGIAPIGVTWKTAQSVDFGPAMTIHKFGFYGKHQQPVDKLYTILLPFQPTTWLFLAASVLAIAATLQCIDLTFGQLAAEGGKREHGAQLAGERERERATATRQAYGHTHTRALGGLGGRRRRRRRRRRRQGSQQGGPEEDN